jgi:hypothetical protein
VHDFLPFAVEFKLWRMPYLHRIKRVPACWNSMKNLWHVASSWLRQGAWKVQHQSYRSALVWRLPWPKPVPYWGNTLQLKQHLKVLMKSKSPLAKDFGSRVA